MVSFCRWFVFLCALLWCALLGTVRAAEEAPKEKSEVPAGYEDADKANKRRKKVRKRIPIKRAPPKINADNAQIKALAAQMQQQLKPFFSAELSFARTVCKPSAEQLKQMKDRAVSALEKTILNLAMQQAPQMGRVLGWPGIQPQKKDIGKQFEIAASQIVSEVFSPEVVERYEEEQNHRSEFRARAGAMALVAHLDKRFRLSQEQRAALTDSLQQGWQRQWQAYLQFMGNNPEYFPPVPDEAILPHLNEVQAKQWKSMKRTNIGFGWQHMNRQGIFREMKQEFDWFGEPNEGEKAKQIGVAQFLIAPAEAVVEEVEE